MATIATTAMKTKKMKTKMVLVMVMVVVIGGFSLVKSGKNGVLAAGVEGKRSMEREIDVHAGNVVSMLESIAACTENNRVDGKDGGERKE